MRFAKLFDRLDLYNQPLIDEQINSESTSKMHAVKVDVDRPLPVDPIPQSLKARGKYEFIDAFQQTRSKIAMNPDGSIYSGWKHLLRLH